MTLASRFMGQALKLPPVTSRAVDVDRDLRVPMPDGVVLLADRYAPRIRPWPQPVRIFVTGADEWRDLPAWPPETRPHRWHLHPDGVLA
jgi:predicted acyl esterase